MPVVCPRRFGQVCPDGLADHRGHPGQGEAGAGADFGLGALLPAELDLFGVPAVEAADELLGKDLGAVATEYEPSGASDGSGYDAHSLLLEDVPAAQPVGFVVSVVGARKRRLHFVGHCFRRPGEHYRDFTVFGDTVPTEADFDKVCCSCFPRGFVAEDELPEDSGSGDTDSSSTTNGSGA